MWTPWASTFLSTPYLFGQWWFSAWVCWGHFSLACPLLAILIPCKVAWLSCVWKYLGSCWTSYQCPWYCPVLSCSYFFFMSLVYQACFPSGTPGLLPLGTSLSGPPVGYLLGLVPVFCCDGHWLFGRGNNVRYAHIVKLIFSFLTVFASSQSDIHWESYDILKS